MQIITCKTDTTATVEILVPDWLITSHVTSITSSDWLFTYFGQFCNCCISKNQLLLAAIFSRLKANDLTTVLARSGRTFPIPSIFLLYFILFYILFLALIPSHFPSHIISADGPVLSIDGSEYIDYDDQSTWPELCLTGQLQSPIDLPDDVYSMKEAASINTPSAASDTTVMVANDDDHAIKVAYYPGHQGKRPIRTRYLGHVTGYQPIREQYFLVRLNRILQTHLHWGGSEHTIGGRRFDVECHLVTARDDPQSGNVFTVFSRLFEIGAANPVLQDMIHYHNISAESFSGFNLTALFPPTIKGVYQYNDKCYSLVSCKCCKTPSFSPFLFPFFILFHVLRLDHDELCYFRNPRSAI
eukprot:sb/3466095/